MKRKFYGIYGKVFFYTRAILLFAICVTALFFANQIGSVIERAQQEQLASIFTPLIESLQGQTDEEAAATALAFHSKNNSFAFALSDKNGEIIYQTDNFKQAPINDDLLSTSEIPSQNNENIQKRGLYRYTLTGNSTGRLQLVMITDSGGRLYISSDLSGKEIYLEYIEKTAIALSLILLMCILGAALFARQIAKPIREIADDTKQMAQLKTVPAPKIRQDEIGELAADVYSMYETLKSTIAQLETEIAREREMEENQRYFFTAASHDLKTPIAAMSALIEEMIEGIAEDNYENLLKCMKLLSVQKKLISEILDIVRLSSDNFIVDYQNVILSDLIDSILPLITPLSEAKKIKLHIAIPKDTSCRTDKKLLERVLSNIIINALQNTPEQGAVQVYTTQSDDDTVLLSVSNTGERLDEELISKLFEPFYRLDQARSRGFEQSGLGLTIVKRTLNRLKVPFSLENTSDGVLFWMQLTQ